jgi:hypothetical protein
MNGGRRPREHRTHVSTSRAIRSACRDGRITTRPDIQTVTLTDAPPWQAERTVHELSRERDGASARTSRRSPESAGVELSWSQTGARTRRPDESNPRGRCNESIWRGGRARSDQIGDSAQRLLPGADSPAVRVPSPAAFGSPDAIDLVPVDEGRSAPRTWRRLLLGEPPRCSSGSAARPCSRGRPGRARPRRCARSRGATSPVTLIPVHAGTAATSPAWRHRSRRKPCGDRYRRRGAVRAAAHLQRGTVQVTPGQRVQVETQWRGAGTRATALSPTFTCRSVTPPIGLVLADCPLSSRE